MCEGGGGEERASNKVRGSRSKGKWIERGIGAMRLSRPIKRMVWNDCNYCVARVVAADRRRLSQINENKKRMTKTKER